jgi:hypothetical protein
MSGLRNKMDVWNYGAGGAALGTYASFNSHKGRTVNVLVSKIVLYSVVGKSLTTSLLPSFPYCLPPTFPHYLPASLPLSLPPFYHSLPHPFIHTLTHSLPPSLLPSNSLPILPYVGVLAYTVGDHVSAVPSATKIQTSPYQPIAQKRSEVEIEA